MFLNRIFKKKYKSWVYFDIYSPVPIIPVQIKLGIMYNDICSFNYQDIPGGYWNFHLVI